MSLVKKTLFITGASRGIGLAIALRAARDGANIVIAAKSKEPHPKLPGTIYTAAADIEAAGGKALPLTVDVRFEEQLEAAFLKAAEVFGGVDILVNNASAISPTPTLETDFKRYDLMMDINVRGTFAATKLALPYLSQAENPHVLTLSPPLNLEPHWFSPHVAYTLSKFSMSLLTMGWAEEFKRAGIAFNCLWPKTTIATAAVQNLLGGDNVIRMSRKPEIVADAAYVILNRESRGCTGNFFVDEEVLRSQGVSDFRHYQVDPNLSPEELAPDFFL